MTLSLSDSNWTYEDYCQLPDDGQRYEVIDGKLYATPSPISRHQIASRRIQFKLYELEQKGQGWVFNAPMDLIMPGCTPVQPDLFFLGPEQAYCIKEKFVEGVPLLIVEILSRSTAGRDRVIKLNRYAQCGVTNYWLVDAKVKSFEILRNDGGSYFISQALTQEGLVRFQGIEFDIAEIFAPIPGAQMADDQP